MKFEYIIKTGIIIFISLVHAASDCSNGRLCQLSKDCSGDYICKDFKCYSRCCLDSKQYGCKDYVEPSYQPSKSYGKCYNFCSACKDTLFCCAEKVKSKYIACSKLNDCGECN